MGYPTDKLDKAFVQRASSSTARPAWQEWMSRHATVPSSALQAPEVIQGFTGSWAGQYVLGSSQKTVAVPVTPAPMQRQGSHLGLPGMAEINFRPYDWGTTRHGKYGPSLLGHPVSFEVVGPTLKSPDMLHQWVLDTTGPQDTLTLDSCTYRSTGGTLETLPVALDSIAKIYGISAVPEEGLYLVVSLTGAPGNLAAGGTGGLGDGLIGDTPIPLVPPRQAISTPDSGRGQKAKFEIFRVASIAGDIITLESNKRISSFFTIPGGSTPIIRAVTLIKPAAARVVAVPGSGQQVFAIVPPEKSLNSDLMPPLTTWQGGTFDPWLGYAASATPGVVGDYPQANALPIPQVVRRGSGHLQGALGEGITPLPTGIMRVYLDSGVTFSATGDVGQVVHIHGINQVDGGIWQTGTGSQIGAPEMDRLLGHWEIQDAGVAGPLNYYDLRMVVQVDPLTGVPFYGTNEYLRMDTLPPPGADQQVQFQWTLHDPISSLWTSTYLSPDKLDSARLTGIIDPEWVKPTGKNIDLIDAEGSPSRPDKALFGTDGGDPGSLLDLGFRMVLFPAKPSVLDPNKLTPDFDNPITSNEVVLDTSRPSTEQQFIEIDYSSGLITLSHPPNVMAGCQLVPDPAILTNVSNPRGEVVFFASFVPFSQEPGQRSPASRVVGGQSVSGPGSSCTGTESADMYGQRLHWPLEPGQTLTAGQGQTIQLDAFLTPVDMPPTGFIEVVEGYDAPVGSYSWTDSAGHRVCTWGYSSVYYQDPGNGGKTTLLGCFGGGIAGDVKTTALDAPYTAVLRRDLMFPNRGDGSVGTDFQFDTTYGYNKRPSALRFKYGTMTPEADGSVTMDTRDPLTVSHQELFSELFSSWVISGGVMNVSPPLVGSVLNFTELVVLIQGVRTVLPEQPFTAPVGGPGPGYIYIDSTVPSCPRYAAYWQLPLPQPDDVLLGMYEYVGPNVTTWTDLRQPLTDVDKRLDITVGNPGGFDQPADAHFLTLADAVAYARETMNPMGGVGYAGRARRIKVIGPTVEDLAKLPIRPNMSGLIIEGASRRSDGSLGNPTEVCWGGDTAPALFDLAGCDAFTVRNVNFRYIYDTAPSAVPRERCLFDISTGAVADILVENVYLKGPAHGMFYCNTDVDPTATFNRVTFRNCTATELTDYAVYVGSTVANAVTLTVVGCYFRARKLTDAPGPELTVLDPSRAIICGLALLSLDWVIQDCHLLDGYLGILLFGVRHSINRVTLVGTDKVAIASFGAVSLSQVTVAGCYTVPGAVFQPFRAAVLGGTLTECVIQSLDTPVLADQSYYGLGGDLIRCTFEQSVTAGSFARVEGNDIGDLLTLGSSCQASYNKVNAVLGAGSIQADHDCVLTGNVADGSFNPTVNAGADSIQLTNNYFQGTFGALNSNLAGRNTLTGDTFFGSVTLRGSSCTLVNCTIWDGLVTPASVGTQTDEIIQGCVLYYSASQTLYLGGAQVTGNQFLALAGSPALTVNGSDNIFEGNRFGVDLVVDDVQALVQGNRLGILTLTSSAGAALVQGNKIAGAAAFQASSLDCQENVFNGTLTASATNQRYAHNYVGGATTVGLAGGAVQDFVGNTFGSAFSIVAAANTYLTVSKISDNTFAGTVTLNAGASIKSLDNCTIQGNQFLDLADIKYAMGCTFTGNRVLGNLLLTDGSVNVVQGNWLSANLVMDSNTDSDVTGNKIDGDFSLPTASGCVVQGNRVTGDVTLTGSTGVVLNGNYISGALAATGADEYVFTGNRVVGAVTVDVGPGPSNTGVVVGNRVSSVNDGQVAPTNNFVAIGNKLDNNKKVFSVAASAATVNEKNPTD